MSGPGPKPQPCPHCGTMCECDTVDVGIGFVQCGPYYCENCGASEMGPESAKKDFVPPEGSKDGWYPPNGPISPYANTVGGVLVNHSAAKIFYEVGLLDEKPKGD